MLFVAWLLVGGFYLWTVQSGNPGLQVGESQSDYYNLLVHGFLKGELGLDRPVPPALLECTDPYDPAQRPAGVALHDASLYQGKYYIYFGVVPAVVGLLPFRLVTGTDLPIQFAVLGFALGSFTVMLGLLGWAWRTRCPRVGALPVSLVAIAMGLASCQPILLRRASMYELPIASGMFFALVAIACSVAALHRMTSRVRWLAGASVCWGLAIGCRPTYVIPTSLFAAIALVGLWRTRATGGRRQNLGQALGLIAPLAIIGLALAAYNYARFGNPAEFGHRYILSGVYEAKIDQFRFRYFNWNTYAYLFAPSEWGRYFPFFHETRIRLPVPRQHFGSDHPFGLFLHVPWLWMMPLAAGFAWRWQTSGRDEMRTLTAMLAGTAVIMALTLFCFYAAMARYFGDFVPPLALLAALGSLAVLDHANARPVFPRALAVIAVTALAIAAALMVGLFSIQIYGNLRNLNPAVYRAVEARANRLIHIWEGSAAGRGPLRLSVTFPSKTPDDGRELLVQTGWTTELDQLVVRYPDPEHVVLGFQHAGSRAIESSPVAVGRGSHRLEVQFGSLAPPRSWPGYRGWSMTERNAVMHKLRIAVDERVVLERQQAFYPASPGTLRIAPRPGGFSGTLERVERLPLIRPEHSEQPPRVGPDATGTWRLRIRFPRGEPGVREPILVSGSTGAGDSLCVEYVDSSHARWVFDHWGKASVFSPSFAYQPGGEASVEINHAGYATGAESGPVTPQPFLLQGTGLRWRFVTPLYAAARDDLFVGCDPIGDGTCRAEFSGSILDQTQRASLGKVSP